VPLFQNKSSGKTFRMKHEFDLYGNEHAGGRHFLLNGFARRLVLTMRQEAIRKWPIMYRENVIRLKKNLQSLVRQVWFQFYFFFYAFAAT